MPSGLDLRGKKLVFHLSLAFANGIRVNELSIWGLDSGRNRVFTAHDGRYLYVGEDGEGLLALKLDEDAVTDEIFRVHAVSGELSGLGINVIELAEWNLDV